MKELTGDQDLAQIQLTKNYNLMTTYGIGTIHENNTQNYTPIFKADEPIQIIIEPKAEYSFIGVKYETLKLQHLDSTIYKIFTHLPGDTDIISVLKSQLTARISITPTNDYRFGKVIFRILSTEIEPHLITLSLFITPTEKAYILTDYLEK